MSKIAIRVEFYDICGAVPPPRLTLLIYFKFDETTKNFGDTNETRRVSIYDGDRTQTYVTKVKRNATQYHEVYTKFLNDVFIVKRGRTVNFALFILVSLFAEEGEGCLFAVFYAGLIEGVYVEHCACVSSLQFKHEHKLT